MDGTISLSDLAVFVRVAELRSFVAASRALDMPRSTVSRRIAALEEASGCRLLERTTRHVRLTQAGRQLSEGAAPHLRGLERLFDDVISADDVPAGAVRAATPVGLGRAFVGRFLRHMREALPNIQGQLIVTDRRVDLVRDDLDLALVEGPVPDSTWIARRVLSTDALCVASPEYLEAHGTPERPEDLLEHATLHRVAGDERLAHWPLADGGTQVLQPLVASTDVDLIRQAAIDGLGIAFLSRAVIFDTLPKGTLVPILPMVTAPRVYHVLYAERNPPRRVRATLEFAMRYVAEVYAELQKTA